jgi:hypothetical protein
LKPFLAAVAALSAVLVISAGGAASVGESITIDQPVPVTWGEQLSMTAVYTQDHKKSFPPRIYNPTVAVQCGSWRATWFLTSRTKSINLGNGLRSSDFPIGAPTGSGPATCFAWLEYTDGDGVTTILASTSFAIS